MIVESGLRCSRSRDAYAVQTALHYRAFACCSARRYPIARSHAALHGATLPRVRMLLRTERANHARPSPCRRLPPQDAVHETALCHTACSCTMKARLRLG